MSGNGISVYLILETSTPFFSSVALIVTSQMLLSVLAAIVLPSRSFGFVIGASFRLQMLSGLLSKTMPTTLIFVPRAAEAMTTAYHRFHKLDAKIVRIFNTYGPRMRLHDGRAVPAFMSQALRGEDVTIFGSGQQTRSFCYVSDLVDGIIRLMESDVNDPVNIGNPHEMTIEQIAQAIIRLTGSPSKLVYRPLPEDDPKVRQPDITRARTLLGWEPKVPLEEGLKHTIAYFRTKLTPGRG